MSVMFAQQFTCMGVSFYFLVPTLSFARVWPKLNKIGTQQMTTCASMGASVKRCSIHNSDLVKHVAKLFPGHKPSQVRLDIIVMKIH